MKNKFYVTTPIYYGNGLPHIGHFYSTTIANVIYLYNKISGKNSRFTTGIDENSQKSVLKAQEMGIGIWEYLDMMALEHQQIWDYFNIRYTDFIRTTEERHHIVVREVLDKCYNKGDIYEGIYEGMYCVACEGFKKEDDLILKDGKLICPDHMTEVEFLKEKNYFFKLSKYEYWLKGLYEANKDFVMPDFRFNEVKAFVDRGLEDFSISRETNTFGIPLPFDESQVTYVWFDALFNYYTSCKYSRAGDKNNKNFVDELDFWIRKKPKEDKILHVLGKDIIRFHAVFWPCMLASYLDLGEEKNGKIEFRSEDMNFLPNNILTGGFFTVDGQKMSKTIGNVINPVEYSMKYSKELLILYILSAFSIGRDGDYDKNDAILTYNAKLANNFGNLLNRAIVLTLKLELESELIGNLDEEVVSKLKVYNYDFVFAMKNYDLLTALQLTFSSLDFLNLYVTEKEPWTLMKDRENERNVIDIMYTICEGIRIVAINLYSFFPEKMLEVFSALGLNNYISDLENGNIEELINKKESFSIKEKAPILFQKFELEE